ncbi:hypothetical protein Tcan_08143 [Toxocara canis]|uniref:Uncharacterized protein n=1 Tax=Toxocara canis TaxID=6265 RepID=A0A0B2VV81_TOXCA|nr:hypothetical protein Tcan_08143 [Toxocara canis]
MLIKMLKRRRTDEQLFDNVLDDIYPDDEEFIANLRQSSRHRIPPYRAAIIRVCQLQLKLCTKMMELRSASNSRQEEPSTLKRLARRSILRHSIRNRAGKISLLQNDGNGTNKFDIREVLPGELIDYLKDGVREE